MAPILKLYNTFTKKLNPVEISGKLIRANDCNLSKPTFGSHYICGPTVYSDSHLGHAITYVRSDVFRRFMRSQFNVYLLTVMNITDIDDKILDLTLRTSGQTGDKLSADPKRHPFKLLSEKYYRSHMNDMESIRVEPPDLTIKVSEQIHHIIKFISRLEQNGHTYSTSNGDIYFKVQSVKNYTGRIDSRKQHDRDVKNDPRDFVLWKAAKPNEPVWQYESLSTGKIVPGRPGWHVQCSAIASAMFGKELDFHSGGQDLIFPHHYNEEACCCAYHSLDTTDSLHVWSKNWLHFGHVTLRESKMSKSDGNVVAISSFTGSSSVNALRLLCINSHYRSNIDFNDELIQRAKALDHKLSAFNSFLDTLMKYKREHLPFDADEEPCDNNSEIHQAIETTRQDIIEGVCEDFDLGRGLSSILDLAKFLYSQDRDRIDTKMVVSCWVLLKEWCHTCGLEYADITDTSTQVLLELLIDYRQSVRSWALEERKRLIREGASRENLGPLDTLLRECDKLRARIDEHGFVIRDPKAGK